MTERVVALSWQGTDSLVVEVEDTCLLARFTVWETGSYVAEILDLATEAYVLDERVEFETFSVLHGGYDRFLQVLGAP